jgi:hypothetical protein
MRDRENGKGSISGGMLALIVAGFILGFALLTWGPLNTRHVASNPGPSGTPGSTAVDSTPPPAASPSGNTTGSAR